MGLFFNRDEPDYSAQRAQGQALVNKAKGRAQEDEDEYNVLKAKQKADAEALKRRSTNMSGGGRAGLMYGGNAQGVA